MVAPLSSRLHFVKLQLMFHSHAQTHEAAIRAETPAFRAQRVRQNEVCVLAYRATGCPCAYATVGWATVLSRKIRGIFRRDKRLAVAAKLLA